MGPNYVLRIIMQSFGFRTRQSILGPWEIILGTSTVIYHGNSIYFNIKINSIGTKYVGLDNFFNSPNKNYFCAFVFGIIFTFLLQEKDCAERMSCLYKISKHYAFYTYRAISLCHYVFAQTFILQRWRAGRLTSFMEALVMHWQSIGDG